MTNVLETVRCETILLRVTCSGPPGQVDRPESTLPADRHLPEWAIGAIAVRWLARSWASSITVHGYTLTNLSNCYIIAV
jgi:hypothetical protein